MAEVRRRNTSNSLEYSDCQGGHIAEAVRADLNENILLTAKPTCKILGLDYRYHGDYVVHVISRDRSDARANPIDLSAYVSTFLR